MLNQLQLPQRRWLLGAFVAVIAMIASFLVTQNTLARENDTRPNIVLLVVDDAGFSDFFASEADTPNVDALRGEGMTLTQFHVMPTCGPTRAVIMSGMDNHIAGVGRQGQNDTRPQAGMPGYEAYLRMNVVSVATLLKDSGYHTYHIGKWHLGIEEEPEGAEGSGQAHFPRGTWPVDRGFERSAGMLEGGAEHYGDCGRNSGHCTYFVEDDRVVTTELDPSYFSAKYHTDKAIEYIDAGRADDNGVRKPFFLYFADTLVHEPNQVPVDFYTPEEWAEITNEYYTKGWDQMREERLVALKAMGMVPDDTVLPERYHDVPDWNDESDVSWNNTVITQSTPFEKSLLPFMNDPIYAHMWEGINTVDDLKMALAKKMAVYRGMIEYYDQEVGRLMQHLKDIGEYDNTVIIFFSDNGGDGREWDYIDRNWLSRKGIDNSVENMGDKGSFIANGKGWAQVANTPLDTAKIVSGEAGVRAPAIVVYSGTVAAGSVNTAFATVQDVAPTVLDYAGVTHPVGVGVAPNHAACTGTYGARTEICPMNGSSLRQLVEGAVENVHLDKFVGWEMHGLLNDVMYYETAEGLFKIRKVGLLGWGVGPAGLFTPWSLYNLTEDPTESNDLSTTNPDMLRTMLAEYNKYLNDVGFVSALAPVNADATLGSTMTQNVTIRNLSAATDVFTVSCVSDWDCSVSLPSEEVRISASSTMTVSVDAGAANAIQVAVSVTAPPTALNGDTNATQVNWIAENSPERSDHNTVVTFVEGNSQLRFPVIFQNWFSGR